MSGGAALAGSGHEPVLSVAEVHHRFGPHRVLHGVNLTLHAGECGVLFGRNGCGKSTLLTLLSTRYRLQRGTYRLDGLDARLEDDEVRGRLLFIGHQTHLYGHLTPLENMRFFSDLRGLPCSDGSLRETIANVGLQRFVDRPVRWFSAGMKKRLALGRMLVAQPKVVLLDEPYSALDLQGVQWLNGVLEAYLRQGGVVVIATHDPQRIAALLHRPFRLHHGRLYPQGDESPC